MMKNSYKIKGFSSVVFRFLRVVIVLAVAVGAAKLLISLKEKPEKKQIVKTPPSVKIMVVKPVSKTMTIDAYGTVKPRKLVKIAVEVPGRIDYLHPSFIEGGMIGKGDLLVGIDQRSYQLERQTGQVRIRQANADIESLKQDIENLKNDILLSTANVDLTQKELERVKTLTRNQFASKNSLDKAEQQYLQAKIQLQNIRNRLFLTDTLMEQKKAALAMARVDLQKADLALQKTRINSEFNGFVLDKFVEKAEYVTPGQILGAMYQKNSLDVDVRIPLEKMKWIESFFLNGKMPVAKVIVANFDSIKTYVWDAKVARLKANIDEKTRTLPMTLEILNPDVKIKHIFDLRPGTFVKCSIMGQTYDNLFVLPRHLLRDGDVFFTVNDSHLKMKKVTVLRKFEEEIYISKGLAPGDKIITSPLPGAREGMALTIKSNGN
ncbi:efflux RND transporter periplasmic adaptor subunit [Desulfobacula toluolica]|uniref:MdtA: predicted multidrug resistance protein A n=1 Tax=Desulfobacula toluolica (strain DSM 7467 / Tol2) TaxID=651182 RepID=K0NJ32_DESTT|nr:efflux RND transporter periplasmic adaptor subunit [Desulfobacula toluolica]CCK81476.1 MdtA: predicted multidrug resistance protein A [Desulfobacula toluolica Tol2]